MKPPHKFSFRNSSKHFGGTSSRFMDSDVIEIPPPIPRPSKLVKQKQKQSILHDVIDIDNDDDSADLVIIGEKVSKSNKGKTIEAVHDGYVDHQVMEVSGYTFCQPDAEKFGSASGIEFSNGCPSVSHNIINIDGHFSDLSYDDDICVDLSKDYLDVDEYALLQAQFDNVNIPTGIEASIPWFPEYDLGLKKPGNSSSYPWSHMQSDAKNSHLTDSSRPSRSLEPTIPKIQGSSVGSSNFPIKMDNHLFSQAGPSKRKSATSQGRRRDSNLPLGVESSKSEWFLGPSQSKTKPAIFGSSTNHGFVENSKAMKVPRAGKQPFWSKFKSAKKAIGRISSYYSNLIGHVGSFHPLGIISENPYSHNFKPFDPPHARSLPKLDNTWVHNSARDGKAVDSRVVTISREAEILRKFQSFKQFDTVEDTSDHYFIVQNSSMKQHPKKWAKKIQEEWKILEKHLPDSIFVRVCESRMDLLRAVIIGAEGTPYHGGLFFFDVFFPSDYPNVPPKVHYHSGGLRLNPNLYHCGRVCLSLLNTWYGNMNEMWRPGVSTILQVLVSIQGLILNTKPFFNEPGYESLSGSANGETKSLKYNEDTFILSLRTMMYIIKKPPKNFKDFVVGHFCNRAGDILLACKAYMEGAQVGCLVKGGVQDIDEGDKSCSKQFKESLTEFVKKLVKEFARIGAKDCEKFLSPVNKPLSGLPKAAT